MKPVRRADIVNDFADLSEECLLLLKSNALCALDLLLKMVGEKRGNS